MVHAWGSSQCIASLGDWVKSCTVKRYAEPGAELEAICSDANPGNAVSVINIGLCASPETPIADVGGGVLTCSAVKSILPGETHTFVLFIHHTWVAYNHGLHTIML